MFERTARIRAIETSLKAGKCRVLYIRVPYEQSDRVDAFAHYYPDCKVRVIRNNPRKYVLLQLTPKKKVREEFEIDFSPEFEVDLNEDDWDD
jgi:hypothetical protein